MSWISNLHRRCLFFFHIFKPNFQDDNGSPVKWSKIMQMKFTTDNPEKMCFQYLYSEHAYREAAFLNGSRKSKRLSTNQLPVEALPKISDFPKCYLKQPGITKQKLESLEKLCKKNLIPPHHQHYYKNLHVMSQEDCSSNDSEPDN